MKRVIDFLLGEWHPYTKIYFYTVVLSGAYFTHRGNYTIAFLELVIIMLLIKKNRI